ncbi:hypothetical protein ACFL2H_03935 [Planctomycetota bacterium]
MEESVVACIGAVYNIKPFVRVADDILDELFRKQSFERRPRPEQKRVWAEMAKGAGSCPGVNRLFVELGVEVYRRDPDRDNGKARDTVEKPEKPGTQQFNNKPSKQLFAASLHLGNQYANILSDV